MRHVLVCPPTHFTVAYAINPWMDPTQPIDQEQARRQHQALVATYEAAGVTVHEIVQDPALPDMVFTANHGMVVGDRFIPANFKHAERQPESALAANWFHSHGKTIESLPESVTFEGQGDLLEADDVYYLGWGVRSQREAQAALASLLPKSIVPIELVDPHYFHLDTCFAPLGTDAVLIVPSAIAPASLREIRERFATVIEATRADSAAFACNLIRVDETVLTSSGLSQPLVTQLEGLGFVIHPIDTTEFLKAGGSVKCLSLIWDE